MRKCSRGLLELRLRKHAHMHYRAIKNSPRRAFFGFYFILARSRGFQEGTRRAYDSPGPWDSGAWREKKLSTTVLRKFPNGPQFMCSNSQNFRRVPPRNRRGHSWMNEFSVHRGDPPCSINRTRIVLKSASINIFFLLLQQSRNWHQINNSMIDRAQLFRISLHFLFLYCISPP